MKYALFNESGELSARYDTEIHGANIPAEAVEIPADLFYQTIRETNGVWRRDPETGEIAKHPFPPPTHKQIELAKITLVQNHMDDIARTHRYDDIKTACTYAEEPSVQKFQLEGQAFRAWRSLVWEKCYEVLDGVNAGQREALTDEELISALPLFALPSIA